MGQWVQVGKPHNHHGVEATAFRCKDAKIQEHFELGIFFGSFQERVLVSSRLLQPGSCSHSTAIFFDEARGEDLRTKYDAILTKQLGTLSKQAVITIDNISIKNVEDNLETILRKIPPDCWSAHARWFVDIGGSPIAYFLGLIGYLRDLFPRPKLTIFNPTGDYGQSESGYTFTSGFDKNIWVPRLWGRPEAGLPWTYVFLLGWEGNRSHEVFYLCEPEDVKALIGSPGYQRGDERLALSRNEMFLKETGLWPEDDQPQVLRADAGDPVQTWLILQQIVDEQRGKSNVCFVPVGLKGHALGAGLCALANGTPAVLYHMPRTYSVRDVKRGQFLWKYEISL